MTSMNNVTLVGSVGAQPELRESKNGVEWMRLSLATRRNFKKDDRWEEETEWHKVKLFGHSAQQAMKRCKPGTQVVVDGRLSYDTWTDDDGQKRRAACVIADRVVFGKNQVPRATSPA